MVAGVWLARGWRAGAWLARGWRVAGAWLARAGACWRVLARGWRVLARAGAGVGAHGTYPTPPGLSNSKTTENKQQFRAHAVFSCTPGKGVPKQQF